MGSCWSSPWSCPLGAATGRKINWPLRPQWFMVRDLSQAGRRIIYNSFCCFQHLLLEVSHFDPGRFTPLHFLLMCFKIPGEEPVSGPSQPVVLGWVMGLWPKLDQSEPNWLWDLSFYELGLGTLSMNLPEA
jgi:hypothetical protein